MQNCKNFGLVALCLLGFLLTSCRSTRKTNDNTPTTTPTKKQPVTINARAKYFTTLIKVDRSALIKYARTLKGTPYLYGGNDPKKGLDCSGFVFLVLNKFNIKSPRISKDFTNEGATIPLNTVIAGDILLFTGSDNSSGIVGHLGFVTENKNGKITFIHSASGKKIGVTETELAYYWAEHFVKAIQIFER
jgi:cell wall-associated NlpC family hydrolase